MRERERETHKMDTKMDVIDRIDRRFFFNYVSLTPKKIIEVQGSAGDR